MSYNEEEVVDEINEEEIFGENEVTDLDDDLVIEDEIFEDDVDEETHEDEDYDYITAEDVSDYTTKSVIAMLFCFPIGLLSFSYSRKTKEALRRDDLQSAIDYSDKAGLYFKISLLLFIVIAATFPFVYGSISSASTVEQIDETVVNAPQEVPEEVPQWEISAKKILHLEKAFYVNNGKYRYYYSEEMANDNMLSFRYDEGVEKFHYMTKFEDDKIYVIAYEVGKTPETGKTYKMDMDYNIEKYGFENEEK